MNRSRMSKRTTPAKKVASNHGIGHTALFCGTANGEMQDKVHSVPLSASHVPEVCGLFYVK